MKCRRLPGVRSTSQIALWSSAAQSMNQGFCRPEMTPVFCWVTRFTLLTSVDSLT
jgi:hypothetical protein